MRLSYYWLPLIEVAKNTIQDADSTYESVIARLASEIEQAKSKSLSEGYAQEQVDSAQFAIVACIDEQAIDSDWQGTLQWIKKPLQLIYFSTTRAGADFFTKADGSINDIEVKEVYALVLSSGFTGIYKNNKDPKLEIYRNNFLNELTEQREIKPLSSKSKLFPDSAPPALKNNIYLKKHFKPNHTALIAITGVPLTILLIFYFFLSFQISDMAEKKIKSVTPVLQIK